MSDSKKKTKKVKEKDNDDTKDVVLDAGLTVDELSQRNYDRDVS
jgi:hypothetical protein